MLELFFVRILRQQENLGLKKPNNCSYSFRLQVQQSRKKVSWQRGWKGCPDPIPNNCSPKPEPGHWAAGPAGRKANNYSQFWRLQVWALGQVIPNNNSFCRPRQVRTRTKKPRAVKLGAVILHSSRTTGGAKFYLFSNSWIFCLRIILNQPSPGVFFFLRSKRFNSFLSSSSSDILDIPFF